MSQMGQSESVAPGLTKESDARLSVFASLACPACFAFAGREKNSG